MSMYDNYIFDLYGTLIDIHTDQTLPSLWYAMAEHYDSYGTRKNADQLKLAYEWYCRDEMKRQKELTGSEYPEIDLTNVFLRMHETGEGKTHVMKTAAFFRTYSRMHMILYPYVKEMLGTLQKEEKKIWLLSNAQTCFTAEEMDECGLLEYFDGIYISSAAGVQKPDPAFMQKLLDETRIDPEKSVVVGNDFQTDIRTADDFGMASIYLNTFAYSDEVIEAELKKLKHPEKVKVIKDPLYAEVKDILE